MTYENLDAKLVNSPSQQRTGEPRSLGDELDVSVTTVSNHLRDLEEEGVIRGYTPIVDYDKLGYDVTAVLQLKVEGSALPDVTEKLRQEKQMVSVYEVTGDYDVIAIGKFTDTDGMNAQIKSILTDADTSASRTPASSSTPSPKTSSSTSTSTRE